MCFGIFFGPLYTLFCCGSICIYHQLLPESNCFRTHWENIQSSSFTFANFPHKTFSQQMERSQLRQLPHYCCAFASQFCFHLRTYNAFCIIQNPFWSFALPNPKRLKICEDRCSGVDAFLKGSSYTAKANDMASSEQTFMGILMQVLVSG